MSDLASVRSSKQRVQDFFVDVFVMNTFSYAVAAPIELLIAGMSFESHLNVRLVALVLNTMTARPYGLWREYLLQRFGVTSASARAFQYGVDTLIFISFQLPLYVCNMALGGATLSNIVKAAPTAALLSGFMGGPYGVYLDWVRAVLKLKPIVANAPLNTLNKS